MAGTSPISTFTTGGVNAPAGGTAAPVAAPVFTQTAAQTAAEAAAQANAIATASAAVGTRAPAPIVVSGPVPLGPLNLTPLLTWLTALSNGYLVANGALSQGAAAWQGQTQGVQSPSTLAIAQTELVETTQAGNQLLAAASTVTSPTSGLAGLYIPPTTQALRAALLELEAWRSGTLTAPSGTSGISKGAAVGIGAGAATVGGIVGGFIGHAIGIGSIFAGEAREAREGRRSKKKKRGSRGRA